MRRWMVIAMVILGLNMVITGIWNLFPPFNTMLFLPHVITSCIFGILAVIHICLNRKPLLGYFKRLRRGWILVGLGFAAVIWVGIILPILVKAGSLTL